MRQPRQRVVVWSFGPGVINATVAVAADHFADVGEQFVHAFDAVSEMVRFALVIRSDRWSRVITPTVATRHLGYHAVDAVDRDGTGTGSVDRAEPHQTGEGDQAGYGRDSLTWSDERLLPDE